MGKRINEYRADARSTGFPACQNQRMRRGNQQKANAGEFRRASLAGRKINRCPFLCRSLYPAVGRLAVGDGVFSWSLYRGDLRADRDGVQGEQWE